MLDRLWARYSHVWGAFDGVVQYAAALAGQGVDVD